MSGICGMINDGNLSPADTEGCRLPVNHGGRPHEYVATDGRVIQWEVDLECDCDHCMRAEGDYCTVYWKKADEPAIPDGVYDNRANLRREEWKGGAVVRFLDQRVIAAAPPGYFAAWGTCPDLPRKDTP